MVAGDELPGYDGPPASGAAIVHSTSAAAGFPTKHAFAHTFGGKDTCAIIIWSRATQPGNRPLFYPGDVVSGSLELDLSKKLNVKGIDVKLRGFTQMTAFAGMQEHQLQTAGMKESFSVVDATLDGGSSAKTFEKGKYSMNFSFTIPRKFTWKGENEYEMPPGFVGKGLPQSFAYDLEVQVRKKGMFSTDELFVHPFRIVPFGTTQPYGPLREAVYAQGATELVGPADDPDGWELVSSSVKGRLFEQEDVDISLRLSLATPLSYPLDGYIPFILSFESSDKRALDLLSSASSFTVSLSSKVVYGTDVSRSAGKAVNEHRDIVAKASVWAEGGAKLDKTAAQYTKTWNGEIRVPKEIVIQFVSPIITLSYSVDLMLQAPGFNPFTALSDSVYLTSPVLLGTLPPDGPRARSMFPAPSYTSGSS